MSESGVLRRNRVDGRRGFTHVPALRVVYEPTARWVSHDGQDLFVSVDEQGELWFRVPVPADVRECVTHGLRGVPHA